MKLQLFQQITELNHSFDVLLRAWQNWNQSHFFNAN